MTVSVAVTLAIAILGAGLGILNTWQSADRDRVKLRLSPMAGYPITHGKVGREPMIGIEVINRSAFPVTIEQVGFQRKGSKDLGQFWNPLTTSGERLPIRMEPRSALTFYVEPETAKTADFLSYTRPFVITGERTAFYGSRRMFSRFQRSFKKG